MTHSITSPFGPIISLITFLFGMGLYTAHGYIPRRLLRPSQWIRKQYPIWGLGHSAHTSDPMEHIYQRLDALESLRDLLTEEYLLVDKAMAPSPALVDHDKY